MNHRQGLSLRVIVELWVMTHSAAFHKRWFANDEVTLHQGGIDTGCRLLGFLQESKISCGIELLCLLALP